MATYDLHGTSGTSGTGTRWPPVTTVDYVVFRDETQEREAWDNELRKYLREFEIIEGIKEEEEMAYGDSLVDFALLLGMKQEEVDKVRHILKRSDWKDRVVLFLLCREIHAGNLSFGQLGYREEKD